MNIISFYLVIEDPTEIRDIFLNFRPQSDYINVEDSCE